MADREIQSKQLLDKNQRSKFCQSSVKQTHFQNLKKKGSDFFYHRGTLTNNRPFAQSGHMARKKLHWDANYALRLSKQRKVGLDWYEFFCFGNPTA